MSTRESSTIANDTFKALEHLKIEELRIRAQNLRAVEPLAFQYFPELKTLSMRDTNGMSISDFYPAWIGLQNTKIRQLVLSSMTMEAHIHVLHW